MVRIVSGVDSTVLSVRPYANAMQVSAVPDGASYSVAGRTTTGAISANLTALSPLFLARLDPSAGASYHANITRLTVQWTTIAAFTTTVTASRRLAVYRGSGAAGANGTALTAVRKDLGDSVSEMNAASGGDIRITSSASALTTAATFETQEIATIPLVSAHTAGFSFTQIIEFDTSMACPVVLGQGEMIAIRNVVNLDSAGAGTFELAVTMEWDES